ncbi:MAG: hypothetical protein E6173_10220 [Streptococcus agalactiae]|nr:hypothetical protein [Streptococcus agalactiae]
MPAPVIFLISSAVSIVAVNPDFSNNLVSSATCTALNVTPLTSFGYSGIDGISFAGCTSGNGAGGGLPVTGVPQLEQNFTLSSSLEPQFEQYINISPLLTMMS